MVVEEVEEVEEVDFHWDFLVVVVVVDLLVVVEEEVEVVAYLVDFLATKEVGVKGY